MAHFKNVLFVVANFLDEAHSLGLIKEFNLKQCEQISENAISGTDVLLTSFFKNLSSAYGAKTNEDCLIKENKEENVSEDKKEPVKIDDCSVIKCDKETKENMSEEKKVIEIPISKNSLEMQVLVDTELTKSGSCLISDYVEGIKVKKCEGNEVVEPPVEKEDEMQVNTDEASEMEEHSKEELVQMPVNTNEISKTEENSNEKLVQIQVDTNEMKRRISAFIKRKRKEVDEWNVQEFCGRSYIDEQDPAWEQSNSCARVDVVFVPRRGSRSHIKVSKVQNVCGPQTQLQSEAKKIKQDSSEMENQPSDPTLNAIEERLRNMEFHLRLKSDSSLRSNIFQRLKELENRILLLESTSPEYIHLPNSDYSSAKNKSIDKEKIYLNYSTDELRNRIRNLKQSCKVFT